MLNILTEGDRISFEAGEAMVEPYVFVQLNSGANHEVIFQAASTSVATPIIGCIQNSASDGEAVVVQISGVTKAVADAAISKGARVHVGAIDGRIDDDEDGTAGACYVGIALEAATARGQVISVLLNCPAIAEDGGS